MNPSTKTCASSSEYPIFLSEVAMLFADLSLLGAAIRLSTNDVTGPNSDDERYRGDRGTGMPMASKNDPS
jgi:hypothetical protein